MASQKPPRLPSELENDQQTAVLYSPFRERSLNPQSWSKKMQFWQQVLSQTALERRMVTVDVPALSLLFERNGIVPKCLGTVVEEMKKCGQIESVDEQRRTQSWLSWGFSTLVKQPLTWGVARLLGATHADKAVYVWPAVVKVIPDHIVDFPNRFSELVIVIQFCKRGEISARPIREIDVQIYRIHMAEKKLETDIEALTLTVERLLTEARSHLRQGKKNLAKHCLRKKRRVMMTMDKRYACLSKLQDILHNIQEAGTHDMVVKACVAGSSVLTHLHKHLSAETVEDVMDDVRELTLTCLCVDQTCLYVECCNTDDTEY
ncbi:unnamed protein product [Candidula unifasciata]|uniref:Charged multivesicular body protein 7 n=1 Tax=Candidula unifasciata TaxID=100452 RepID=A0A8S3ZT38_9EUPU|nr:unnamed protein product [Candidula unifasciata]